MTTQKRYNTVKTDKIVDDSTERRFLDALSACVVLSPAEEERIMPSRTPVAGQDDVDADDCDESVLIDDHDPDLDDIEPSADDLANIEGGVEDDAELVHALLFS